MKDLVDETIENIKAIATLNNKQTKESLHYTQISRKSLSLYLVVHNIILDCLPT